LFEANQKKRLSPNYLAFKTSVFFIPPVTCLKKKEIEILNDILVVI